MKHSPGPWSEEVTKDGELWVRMGGDGTHDLFMGDMENTCGVCHANAELMAAAPTLLEACKRAIQCIRAIANYDLEPNLVHVAEQLLPDAINAAEPEPEQRLAGGE